MTFQQLAEMSLHDFYTEPDKNIMRVPGGWIYKLWSFEGETIAVFVSLPNRALEVNGVDYS